MSFLLVASAVLLTVLAYPPTAAWPAGCVMLAPVVAALERSGPARSFALVYGYSLAMALVIARWLVQALAGEYGVAPTAAWAFTGLLIAAYALVPATAALAYRALRPRVDRSLAPVLFGALWTLGEWLRSEPGGVPWLLAAHVVAPLPLAFQTADLGGVYAVGFLVATGNAALGVAVARWSPRPLLVPALLLALSIGYGMWRLTQIEPRGRAFRVGVVQAAVPQSQRFQPGSAERNTRRHIELTRSLVAHRPVDLVVWSETAVDTDLDRAPRLLAMLEQFSQEIGTPIVTGAPRSHRQRRTNSVVLLTPGSGMADHYDKQRLVPFSEYDPPGFAWLAPLLGPVTEGDPYLPGREPRILRGASLALAAPVCFEICYPDLARRFRERGSDLLLNLSNDAWFGRTGYAELHFLHARFRAVELRTWVVRAANTGISAVIDPAGRVVASLPTFTEGTLAGTVDPAGPAPFYARSGDAPVLGFLGAVVGLVSLAARRRSDP